MLDIILEKPEKELEVSVELTGAVYVFAVDSVNGKTGDVVLEASDVDAIPVPATAKIGQTVKVSAIDDSGKPIAWEVTDMADFPTFVLSWNDQVSENNLNVIQNIINIYENAYQLYLVVDDEKITLESSRKTSISTGDISYNIYYFVFTDNSPITGNRQFYNIVYNDRTKKIAYSTDEFLENEFDATSNKAATMKATAEYVENELSNFQGGKDEIYIGSGDMPEDAVLQIDLEDDDDIPEGNGSAVTPRIEMTASDTSVTLEPNKLYVFPEMSSLSVTLGGTADPSIVQEYKFRFTSGGTATALTLPADINGHLAVEVFRTVEVSIVDGLLSSKSWIFDPSIPSEYTRLNYIESTGTQWIDTGYTWSSDNEPSRVYCKWAFTDISRGQVMFGCTKDSSVNVIYDFGMDTMGTRFTFARWSGNPGYSVALGTVDANVHTFDAKSGDSVYFDGSRVAATSGMMGSYTGSGTRFGLFTLFRANSPDASLASSARLYEFVLEGANGIRNYVPAQRNSDGEIGLFEMITQTFFTNSGTGSFIGG